MGVGVEDFSGCVEGEGFGELFVEGVFPGAEEVDGVGEDEAGEGVEDAGGEEVADLVVGLVGDPGVDGEAGGLGVAGEVDAFEAGLVVGAGDGLEVGLDGVAVLEPEAVGDFEEDASGRGVALGLGTCQGGEGGVQLLRG